MSQILFKNCKLVISENLPTQHEKLFEVVLDSLQFTISGCKPLVIEKQNVTQKEMLDLIKTLTDCSDTEHNANSSIHSYPIQCSEPTSQATSPETSFSGNKIDAAAKSISNAVSTDDKDVISNNATGSVIIQRKSFAGKKSEQILRDSDPKQTNVHYGHKDTAFSPNGAEAKVSDARKGGTNDALPTQNDSDFDQVQNCSYDSDMEVIVEWPEDWQLECAKRYLKTATNGSFFDSAARKDTHVTFKLCKKNPDNELFIKNLNQLKFSKIEILNMKAQKLEHRLAELDKTGAKIKISDNHFLIVGTKDEVSNSKKIIIKRFPDQAREKRILSESGTMLKKDEDLLKRSGNSVNDDNMSKSEHEAKRSYNSEFHTSGLQAASSSSDINTNNLSVSSYRSSEKNSNRNRSMFLTKKSNLKIKILEKDITKLKVDCIVNAANRKLCHNGGVAKAIAYVGGRELTLECEDYTKTGKLVEVTDIFLSKGGKLPAKYVLHAVGPKWESYKEKMKCLHALRHTVLRCLVEADRLGMSSIALPSISAASSKVPQEFCARCYMEAVKHFDEFNAKEQTALREVYFTDVDDTMVNCLAEYFTNNWDKPCDRKLLRADLEFAANHIYSTSKVRTTGHEKLSATRNACSDSKKMTSSLSLSRVASLSSSSRVASSSSSSSRVALPLRGTSPSASSTETNETASTAVAVRMSDSSSSFNFGMITLHVKCGYAFDYPSDIVITIGKPFKALSDHFSFKKKQSKNLPHLRNVYESFDMDLPEERHSCFLLAVYPEPSTVKTFKDIFDNVEIAIQHFGLHGTHGRIINAVVITSHFLYVDSERNQPQKANKDIIDVEKVEQFTEYLYKFVDMMSRNSKTSISFTVIGCEKSLPIIKQVVKSHDKCLSPEDAETSGGPRLECTICCNDDKSSKPTSCCRSIVCSDCEAKMSVCPFCRQLWRITEGNQPDGTMTVDQISDFADGYEDHWAWRIEYYFPPGRQKEYHPNPGLSYSSTRRTAYLPDTDDGYQVLILLRLAFIRRLTFTIGSSLTKGMDDVIIWNDIHHKTSLHGGSHGYPDGTYIQRVKTELKGKGVTTDTITEKERRDLDDFHHLLKRYKCFP